MGGGVLCQRQDIQSLCCTSSNLWLLPHLTSIELRVVAANEAGKICRLARAALFTSCYCIFSSVFVHMCTCMCICVRLRLHQRRQVRLVGWQGQHCPSPGSSQEPAFSGAQAVLCLILAPTYLAAWLLQPPTDESDDHFPPSCFPISHLASTTKSACPSRPVIFLLVVFFLIINYLASWTDFGLYIYIWCRLFLR